MQEGLTKTAIGHFLYPGMLFVQNQDCVITTILGSCVSVCIWDPALRIGGMNHFLLPLWNGEGLPTPKYGNIAIPLLFERLLGLGSKKNNLVAKVFGGANVLEGLKGILNVGERNIMIAEDILLESKVSVLSRDVGGSVGRKVLFKTESGDVLVKKCMPAGR